MHIPQIGPIAGLGEGGEIEGNQVKDPVQTDGHLLTIR